MCCTGHAHVVVFGPARADTDSSTGAPPSHTHNCSYRIHIKPFRQILFLALPGVILGAGLTAVFVKMILRFDWSWSLAMVFGSMVAATDPVAVVALLEELVRVKKSIPRFNLLHLACLFWGGAGVGCRKFPSGVVSTGRRCR